MAIMAPARDQMLMSLMHSSALPLSYSTDAVMPYASDLERVVEPSASILYPATWQTLQEMQISRSAEQTLIAGATSRGCSLGPSTPRSTLVNSNRLLAMDNSPSASSACVVGNQLNIMEDARIRGVMGRTSLAGNSLGGTRSWDAENIAVNPFKGGLALQGVGASAPAFTSDPALAERVGQVSSFACGTAKYPYSAPRKTGEMPTVFEVQASSSLESKCLPASAASVQPELEAVEGITEAAMGRGTTPHEPVEVTVTALKENHNSFSSAEQLGVSRGESPVKLPSHDTACYRSKRKQQDPSSPDPKISEGEASSNPKRSKGEADRGDKETKEDNTKSSETSAESTESPKSAQKEKENHKSKEFSKQDYIHVRARRGQATDSHSLAERVRREKISERMKYLQDLVPGCKKVTGKAVMLDEIINYVQFLQRQVEHLSMRLASVCSGHADMALESQLLSNKEMLQTQLPSTLSSSSETKADAFGLMQQLDARKQVGPGFLDGTPCRRVEYRFLGSGLDVTAAPFASLADITRHTVPSFHNSATIPQSTGWDSGELQSLVERGLSHHTSRLGAVEGQLPVGHMKAEF
ncbi:uncharacterized protein [Physcomitrium patens]|uniref:BHLH domain-containing protein n=1 Tax=Physcomitrium patens TaxID=3218 RepID=A0A7I4DCN9_PHYPA|nr:transcription factor bHLH49-like [Physcomitrium patens]|eukprot:XP_024362551.1 transcription factor bHLH49-like [Physcomitrella patens]